MGVAEKDKQVLQWFWLKRSLVAVGCLVAGGVTTVYLPATWQKWKHYQEQVRLQDWELRRKLIVREFDSELIDELQQFLGDDQVNGYVNNIAARHNIDWINGLKYPDDINTKNIFSQKNPGVIILRKNNGIADNFYQTPLFFQDFSEKIIVEGTEKTSLERSLIDVYSIVEYHSNSSKIFIRSIRSIDKPQFPMGEIVFLGITSVLAIGLLMLLLRMRNPVALSFTGQLIIALPEECVAELEILKQRLQKEQQPALWIHLRMMQETLALLWVFYIQIRLDNIGLPHIDKRIDD